MYILFGVVSVTFDIFIFQISISFFNIPYLISNFLSINIGIATSFLLNYNFNFNKNDKLFKRFILFYLIGLFGIFISTLSLYFFIDLMNFNKIGSKLISVIIVSILQYTLNLKITFKNFKHV